MFCWQSIDFSFAPVLYEKQKLKITPQLIFTFRYFSKLHLDLLLRVPKSFLILGVLFAILQSLALLLICEVKDQVKVNDDSHDDEVSGVNTNQTDRQVIVVVSSSPKDKNDNDGGGGVEKTNSLGVKCNMPNEGLTVRDTIRTPSFILLATLFNVYPIGPDLFSANYKVSLVKTAS